MVGIKNISLYDFLDKMKDDIRYWWKTNKINCKIDKEVVKKLKELVFHEIIHYKIVRNCAVNIDIVLELTKAEEGIIGFYYNGYCRYNYPYKFNLPKYYPKFILIEFKHFLFDIICDLFKFDFTVFKYRLFKFLKRLIRFKVRS